MVLPEQRHDGNEPARRPHGLSSAVREMARELTVAGRLQSLVAQAAGLVSGSAAVFLQLAPDGTVITTFTDPDAGAAEARTIASVLPGLLRGEEQRDRARRGPIQDEAGCRTLDLPMVVDHVLFGRLVVIGAAGRFFGSADVESIEELVATGALGVENARAYEASELQQEWIRASVEIGHRLLAAHTEHEIWHFISVALQRITRARTVTIATPAQGATAQMEIVVAAGLGSDELVGLRYPAAGSLAAQVMDEQRGHLADSDSWYCTHSTVEPGVKLGQVMALPLGARSGRGAIVISRNPDQERFRSSDLVVAEDFAAQAALALDLADARRHHDRLVQEREQIGRDLHDHTIQRIFAAGLTIRRATVEHPGPGDEILLRVVADLDDTIRQIRSTITALAQDRETGQSARKAVFTVINQLDSVMTVRPSVTIRGPVDTIADPDLVRDVEAVLRESLVNISKHARATAVTINLRAGPDELELVVADDGIGLGDSSRRSGLANLRRRAELRNGSLELTTAPGAGLTLAWRVPLG